MLTQYPQIGIAGSRENAAFARAFRANGGDARGALQVAVGIPSFTWIMTGGRDTFGHMRLWRRCFWWRILLGGVATGVAWLAIPLHAGSPVDLSPPADARQLVLVVTSDWDTVDGTLQCYERIAAGAPWQPVRGPAGVVVGAAGLAWGRGLCRPGSDHTPIKKEGDRRAPAGVFRLSAIFGYAPNGPDRNVHLPYIHLNDTTEGIDDVHSAYYNRIVDRTQIDHPDWLSSEKMRRADNLYQWGVVVDHNTSPAPLPGAGSCIFLHLWRGPSHGTDGCTAMAVEPLGELVHWLHHAAAPVLVQLPRSVYDEARSRGELPPP
jgi:L,D-peptidoglycan transpeptidase YkuD (ErfK/YbiS/YcfS/YnhG family)